jgi:tetratricopeptide (TPR) repeat protein
MTTDWLSAGAMLLAGIIVGVVFLYAMKTRKKDDSADVELRDLEAKRDALVLQIRELADAEDPDEKARLERETANVLRRIDERKVKAKKPEARPEAVVVRHAQIKGFAWGVGSILVLVGIFWYVTQKAQPKNEAAMGMQQNAPMQQQQQPQQAQQSDPEVQGIEAAVSQHPDDLVLRNQLARAYLDRENLMGVFQQTQYILQHAPNDPQALTYQSLVRLAMGQADSANTMLHQAIKADPKFLDAYVALAWAQTSTGKNDDAAATIKEAQKQHPEQSQRLADVLVKMRQTAKNQPAQTSELPPNHPPIEAPGSAASTAPAPAQTSDAAAIHVTLALAPGMTPPAQGIIYVIARPAGVSAGPPAAVKRLPLSTFPLTFDVSSADSMMGQPLPPKIHLEARIDSDGDAMTRDPKDPIATVDNVATGSSTTLTFH